MDKRTRITEILRRLAGKPIDPGPDESLFESGLLDSFALADLVSALEAEFSVSIPDSALRPRLFDSITRIEAYIESRS